MQRLHLKFFFLMILTGFLTGCAVPRATYDWPKASMDADQVLNLESNIEKTAFMIDGVKVATGRRVKALINKKSHTVRAEPPGYTPKEEFIQPPYHSYSSLSFIFMLGDRVSPEPTARRAARPRMPVASAPGYRIAMPLPVCDQPNADAIAVIIGNRNYRNRFSDVPDVAFAHNDADLMRRYATQSLGIREGNIIFIEDATQAQLMSVFGTRDNPRGKLANWVRPGRSDVLIFYSGHGVPGLKDGQGYLLPVDADPSTVDINGYPLETLYGNLSRLPIRNLTVIVDACFCGLSNDGAVVKHASSISLRAVRPKARLKDAILVAASGPSEVASWDREARLGLLTRYLVEGLAGQADKTHTGNHDGRVTVGELKAYLSDEVSYQARRQYGREQNPEVSGDGNKIINILP